MCCITTVGRCLEVHPPGQAPEAGLPAALRQQALPHPNLLALPEAREGGSLFWAHPTASLLLGLGGQEGLQLGVIHICCSDGLRDGSYKSDYYMTLSVFPLSIHRQDPPPPKSRQTQVTFPTTRLNRSISIKKKKMMLLI